ncbi:MAG: adenosylcobinamide-phosphate synthase CbiB [Porphyromonadaceae bacterium]|nr:adenosylcobinamide-phosphate synthase CbiB [Porphyromonadaceae bacterium]
MGLYALVTLAILHGYLLDRWYADPMKWHPIVGMGNAISWGEHRFNKGSSRRLKGALYNGGLVLTTFLIVQTILQLIYSISFASTGFSQILWIPFIYFVCVSLTSFLMLSGTTLIREVSQVFDALQISLDRGREQVGRIVGRDTQALSEQEVRTAALETLSENLSDGVIAPLFWWALLDLPGMVAYKMINTQDSMIGYKNERYGDYGYFSAKLDDAVNYIPARLTALAMILVAGRLDLLRFVWRNGRKHLSPNSGYPEAALAGILDCRFGGPHDYFGQTVDKPFIGERDREITHEDLAIAARINRRSEVLMLSLALVIRLAILSVCFTP